MARTQEELKKLLKTGEISWQEMTDEEREILHYGDRTARRTFMSAREYVQNFIRPLI